MIAGEEEPKEPVGQQVAGALQTPEELLTTAIHFGREGNRNRSGYILACRLKDHGIAYVAARSVMLSYASAVAQGRSLYTIREAFASLRSAYRRKR